MRKVECFFACLIGFLVCQLSFAANPAEETSKSKVRQTLNMAPLAFEQLGDPAAGSGKYAVHRPGMGSDFAPDGVHFLLSAGEGKTAGLAMSFGKRSAAIFGEQPLPGKTNYFHGKDPTGWRTGIPTYSRIRYSRLWPGIDLLFYGNGEHLEHDFVVAPGARPGQIEFQLKDAEKIELTPQGDLSVHMGAASILFKKPLAYQETEAGRRQVDAAFKLAGNKVTFALGNYDKGRSLTIDPVLSFSTFLVGSIEDQLFNMTVDSLGNIYATGITFSPDFPVASAVQPHCASCANLKLDAFISKLDPTGSTLIYSTFLGGNDDDYGDSIAVDSSGHAIVGGETLSSDFPAVNINGPFVAGGNRHMFMASLAANGASLNYSGIIGPLGLGPAFGATVPQSTNVFVAVDGSGNAYATSQTLFATFPITSGVLSPVLLTNPPSPVLMVVKVGPTGTLLYSTAIPGNASVITSASGPRPNTFFQNAIAVDSSGSAYVAGGATAGLPVTPGVVGSVFVPDTTLAVSFPEQGFLLKLNPTGSALSFATYIPASLNVTAMALDSTGIYLAGNTVSTTLPVSANAFRPTLSCGGCKAGYLLKLNSTATSTLLGTYLTTSVAPFSPVADTVYQIALDASRNVFLTGPVTTPLKNPILDSGAGASLLTQISSDFSTVLFASSMAFEGVGRVSVAVAPSGKVIIAGTSSGFPTTPGSFQPNLPPGRGTFDETNISAIDVSVPAPAVCLNPLGLNFGFGITAPGTTSAPLSSTLTNCGNADLHISSVAADSPDYAASTTCPLAPSAVAPAATCTISATYSPVDASSSAHIIITDDASIPTQQLFLSGIAKAPIFFAQPASLTFLETPVGAVFGLSLEILNEGVTNMTVSSITTTGDFTQSNNCVGAVLSPPNPNPFAVQHNFCNVTVLFVPTTPGLRQGSLIISDNTLNSPHTIPLQGPALAAWPTPVVAGGATLNVDQIPIGFETLTLTGGGFSRLTTATVDGIPFNNFSRLINVVGPQQLDLSLADSDFGDVGEVPVQVTTPTPGGGTSNGVATLFAPIKTSNLISRTIEFLGAGNMVVGPKSGLIYDALGNSFITPPNMNTGSLIVVDPAQEQVISALVGFPHAPTALAVSDDEQFLYAAFSDNGTVAQISLATGAINFMASLGSDATLGAYHATAIRVMPGHPHTWAVALQPAFDTKAIALKVFDDATPRATAVEHGNASSIFPGKLLFIGSDTTTLYSINSSTLYRFTIDANGITFKDATSGLGASDFATDGALLYLSTGAIIDPVSLFTNGTFPLAPGLTTRAVVVNGATSRAIFASDGFPSTPTLLQAFDTRTLAPQGALTTKLPGVFQLLRWGTSGLAFGAFSSPLIVTRTSLTGNPALLPPFHIGGNSGASPVSPAQVSSGQNGTYSIGVLGINGFSGPITFSCENLPKFASCSFSKNPILPGENMVVTVSTHQATASLAPVRRYFAGNSMKSGNGFIVVTAVLCLPFALAFAGRRYRGKLLALCLLIAIAGCGGGSQAGGGGGSTPTPPFTPTPPSTNNNTPLGTYDIILTGTSATGEKRHVFLQLVVLG